MDNNKRALHNIDEADLTTSGDEKIADEQQPLKKIKKKETQESSDVNETDANKKVAAEPMDEDVVEAEKLKVVSKLSVKQIEQCEHSCGGVGCLLAACTILSSSLNPSEALLRCWDCTNKDVGTNNITGSIQWLDAAKEYCSKYGNFNANTEGMNELDIDAYRGAYLVLPGLAKAHDELGMFIGDHPFGNFLNNITTISLPLNTTKLEEATFCLYILRDNVHRHLKILAGQWRHEEYAGLNAAGAVNTIIDKFQSVVLRYELTHYTDENVLHESAECIIGIWRDCSTQAEAIDSQHFEDLDTDMKNALRKFWGHTIY